MLYYFSACCNYIYLKNVIKLRLHCLIKNCNISSVQFIVLIKDFSFHLGNFISIFCHPKQMLFAHSQVTGRGPKKGYIYIYIYIYAPTYSTGQKNVTPTERQRSLTKNIYLGLFVFKLYFITSVLYEGYSCHSLLNILANKQYSVIYWHLENKELPELQLLQSPTVRMAFVLSCFVPPSGLLKLYS